MGRSGFKCDNDNNMHVNINNKNLLYALKK